MEALKIPPNAETFKHLFRLSLGPKSAHMNSVMLLNYLNSLGLKPCNKSLQYLVQSSLREPNPKYLLDILKLIRAAPFSQRDYQAVSRDLISATKHVPAFELICDLLEKGHVPDIDVFTLILNRIDVQMLEKLAKIIAACNLEKLKTHTWRLLNTLKSPSVAMLFPHDILMIHLNTSQDPDYLQKCLMTFKDNALRQVVFKRVAISLKNVPKVRQMWKWLVENNKIDSQLIRIFIINLCWAGEQVEACMIATETLSKVQHVDTLFLKTFHRWLLENDGQLAKVLQEFWRKQNVFL